MQRPCRRLGHLSLDQVVQRPVQPDIFPLWPLSMTRCVEPSLWWDFVETKFIIFLGPLLQKGVKSEIWFCLGVVKYLLAPGSSNSTYSAARHLLCPVFLVQFVSNVFFQSHPVATCVLAQGSTATTCWGWWGVKCFGVLQERGCHVQDELPIALVLVICWR